MFSHTIARPIREPLRRSIDGFVESFRGIAPITRATMGYALVYVAIAVWFSAIYYCIHWLGWKHQFSGVAPSTTWQNFFFFSTTIFPPLGSSDIHPISALTQSIVDIELLIGIWWTGVVLSTITSKVSQALQSGASVMSGHALDAPNATDAQAAPAEASPTSHPTHLPVPPSLTLPTPISTPNSDASLSLASINGLTKEETYSRLKSMDHALLANDTFAAGWSARREYELLTLHLMAVETEEMGQLARELRAETKAKQRYALVGLVSAVTAVPITLLALLGLLNHRD